MKLFVAKFVIRSGFFSLRRAFTKRIHGVLAFHRVRLDNSSPPPFDSCPYLTVGVFRQILIYLREHFEVVSLRNLIMNIDSPIPKIAITFDDGWRDNYDYAYPVLKELGLPATIFITSGKIGSAEPFWQQSLGDIFLRAKTDTNKDCVEAFRSYIGFDKYKSIDTKMYADTILKWKKWSMHYIIEKIMKSPIKPSFEEKKRCFLSEEEIKEMVKFGIDIGSHTVNHKILTAEKKDAVHFELYESKKILEDIVGSPIDMISYPQNKVNKEIADIAFNLGYKIGCAGINRCIGFNEDALILPRLTSDWDNLRDEKGTLSYELMQLAIPV